MSVSTDPDPKVLRYRRYVKGTTGRPISNFLSSVLFCLKDSTDFGSTEGWFSIYNIRMNPVESQGKILCLLMFLPPPGSLRLLLPYPTDPL